MMHNLFTTKVEKFP